MRDDFCIFILTHQRPDNVMTWWTLKKERYTGDVYLLVDDQDPTLDQYRENFPEDQIVVFDKQKYHEKSDPGVNDDEPRGSVLYARNATFDVAERLGYDYFMQLDDDYDSFSIRWDIDGNFGYYKHQGLDLIFEPLVDFLEETDIRTICLAQAGDYIGGAESQAASAIQMWRKAMNTFICATDRRFDFKGIFNDDVNTYTTGGRRGDIFFSFVPAMVSQQETQSQEGGLTEEYLDMGTYVKSFFSVMYAPSCVEVGAVGEKDYRIHHRIDWNKLTPKILNEEHRKPREDE